MKTYLIILFTSISFYSCAQNKLTLDQKLIGKWEAISKVETEKTSGIVTDLDKDIYKTGEKTYEFTKNNKLVIIQGFGKHKEELPAWTQGNKLFIGKNHKNKDSYIITYEPGRIKLLKTETKTKKGKNIIETEEVILKR
ncbi:hypothetical protein [Pedobacter sp. UYP1]|uniref:hypothetical protein n=1 Tax=Pedobacter sp. UYP1 TaxID=1756396 RepID=UPI003397655A